MENVCPTVSSLEINFLTAPTKDKLFFSASTMKGHPSMLRTSWKNISSIRFLLLALWIISYRQDKQFNNMQ